MAHQGRGLINTWRAQLCRLAALAVVLMLAIATRAHAQAMSLASFTQPEGLGSLEDNCLLQDRRGFVYTCTENGLFVFDGHTFQRIGAANGLDGSFIAALHEDANGRLWVGTRTGLYVGDGQHFVEVNGPHGPLMIDPGATLTDFQGTLHAVSQHQLWIIQPLASGWQAQLLFDAAAIKADPSLGNINSVFVDGHSIWLGCGQFLCQWNGNTTRVWKEADGIPSDTWTSYHLDRNGALWVRSPHYIRVLAPGASHFISHDIPDAHVVTAYLDMVQDNQGRVLTRSDTGLARWNGTAWQFFDKSNGLPDIGIDALLYDRSNVLWIGTYGRGVLQWRGYERIQSWQAAQGLDSSPTWAMARDTSGTLWVGDELGGSVLLPGASTLTPWPLKAPPLAQETIGLYALPDGDMLAAYYSGELLHYHAQSKTTDVQAHSPAYIRTARIDHLGRVWLCTERGLYEVDGKTLRRVGGSVVPEDVFSDASEDSQGRLWFAGTTGLFRLTGGTWTRVRVVGAPADESFTHIDVLPNGDLYLSGNFDGLWQGRTTDANTLSVTHAADKLVDDTRIYFIRHDRRHWIWIGGTDGVEMFNGQRWRRITQDDGLIWDDIAENAFFEDVDGSIWIGTSNGLSHILHPDDFDVARPFTVRITALDYNGIRQVDASSYRFDYSDAHALTLHLATLDAPTRHTLLYRYRLQGLEQNWVTSERPQVDYPPLPPGHYVFQASVIDPDNRLPSKLVELPIDIVPPWWGRTPAIVAAVGLFILTLAAIWQLRTRRLRQRAAELTRLVMLRTRELETDKQALEEARTALWHQATHDALTGLPNRSHILSALDQAIAHAKMSHQPLAVALLDMDHFKRINDEHGHLIGDEVLIEAAVRLCRTIAPGTTVGRYGGEELLIVAPNIALNNTVHFEALRASIERTAFNVGRTPIEVTCSMGVAWFRTDKPTALDVIRRADAALYLAKSSGRNRVTIVADVDDFA